MASQSRRLVAATATGAACSTISRARACARGRTWSAGSAEFASPQAAASEPVNRRPVSSSSCARPRPTWRTRFQCPIHSAVTPSRTKGSASTASSATNRTSHCIARVSPAPTAAPWIAAMTGLRTWYGAIHSARWVPVSVFAPPKPSSVISEPAEKARPAPVSTIAPTSSAASHHRSAALSSWFIVRSIALSRSGRSRVTVATPSSVDSRSRVSPSGRSAADVSVQANVDSSYLTCSLPRGTRRRPSRARAGRTGRSPLSTSPDSVMPAVSRASAFAVSMSKWFVTTTFWA